MLKVNRKIDHVKSEKILWSQKWISKYYDVIMNRK